MGSFEAIQTLTGEMLAAARAADWDRLAALERICRARADVLAAAEPPVTLSPGSRRRKIEIIHQVLADDAEIRRLAEPRLAELEQMLASLRNQRRLADGYGPESQHF